MEAHESKYVWKAIGRIQSGKLGKGDAELLREAAERHAAPAFEFYWGLALWRGIGTERREKEAIAFLEKARSGGCAWVQLSVARIYISEGTRFEKEIRECLEAAAADGSALAKKILSRCRRRAFLIMMADWIRIAE